jgi:hypothetical protein
VTAVRMGVAAPFPAFRPVSERVGRAVARRFPAGRGPKPAVLRRDRPGAVHRVCAEAQRAFFDPPRPLAQPGCQPLAALAYVEGRVRQGVWVPLRHYLCATPLLMIAGLALPAAAASA